MDKDLKAGGSASLESEEKSRPNQPQPNHSIVDLTEDSDDSPSLPTMNEERSSNVDSDSDLQLAIQLSLQDQQSFLTSPESELKKSNTNGKEKRQSESPKSTPRAQTYGILGIDRKSQEEERLARLARKRKADNDNCTTTAKISKFFDTDSAVKPSVTVKSSPSLRPIGSSIAGASETALEYPYGSVKKTWALSYKRKDDMKIEEVLQASDVKLAVLSSFQWDMDWLFSKFNDQSSRFVLIMGVKGEAMRQQIREETESMSRIRLCFPSMDGEINCMHSKLMLLFHPTYLRVVIPSANLVPFDWGEQGGFMENILFLIDLPLKPENSSESDGETPFREELAYFLRTSNLHENIITKMKKFDFSKTAKYAFIHTIGGSHTGPAYKRTGHCGLGRAVESLGLQTSQPLKLDYVTSSIGSLTSQFMRSMYFATQGDSGSKELSLRTQKQLSASDQADSKAWTDRINVYFPSLKTVQESRGGTRQAGTICFQPKWYNSSSFPKHVLRNNRSVREGLLMHNKMLFVRPESGSISRANGSVCRGWAYVGSANLSESAWGRLVRDRQSKQPKLNCRNWECGVLFPIIEEDSHGRKEADDAQVSNGEDEGVDIVKTFGDAVPVPMQVPGERYRDGDRPWFYMED